MSTNPIVKKYATACLGVLIYLTLSAVAYGAENNTDCLMCHSAGSIHKTAEGEQVPLYVGLKAFQSSLHSEQACVDCHTDLKGQPLKHKPDVAPVDCTLCHAEPEIADSHKRSVHGVENPRAATCNDCHQVHTARKKFDPGTCAKCHKQEYDAYVGSSHSQAWMSGDKNAPTCVTCHGDHDMRAKSDKNALQNPAKSPQMCAKCHDNPQIMAKYNLPTDRLKTYQRSYHGVANKHGDMEIATCASCHDAHEVLSSSDPKSSTNKKNLPETCGKCHTGMNENTAKGKVHVVISKEEGGPIYYVATSFKWLTIGTMVMLIGHICLDLFSRVRKRLSRLLRRTE